MKPAAFLFDLDGTLIDSEMVWAHAIVDWLRANNVETTLEHLAPIVFGHSWMDIHAALHREYPALPPTSVQQAAVELRKFRNMLPADQQEKVIPTSVEFFKKVAKIAPCCIVSGSPHDDVQQAADRLGISHLVKFVLGCEDYGRGKPAPDGYLKAAKMLDVDASECVVVEDSSAGVASGNAAGMRVIGIDNNPFTRQNFTGCAWLVHDLSELDVDAVFSD